MAEEILDNAVEIIPLKEGQTASSREGVAPVEKIEFHENSTEQAGEKYDVLLSKVAAVTPQTVASDDALVVLDARSISETIDEESKVQKLLDLASVKGVAHAVNVARKLNDFYALDRMHDELAGKFYAGLVERGLIEKE